MTHPTDGELQDLSDGLLARAERERIEHHLAVCQSCTDSLAVIESLKADALLLRVDCEPPADEWQAIASRLSERSPAGSRSEPAPVVGTAASRPRALPTNLRVAAGVVLALGLGAGAALIVDRAGTDPSESVGASRPGAPALGAGDGAELVRTLEEAYGPSITELQDALALGRDQLEPETLAVIEENLGIIEAALARARAAIDADPSAPAVTRSLDSLYRAKIQLLRTVAGLTRGA